MVKYPVRQTRVGRSFFVVVRRSKRALELAQIAAHSLARYHGVKVSTKQVKGGGKWGVRVRRVA